MRKDIIVCLRRQAEAPPDPWAAADAALQGNEVGHKPEALYLHIGHQSLSPYESTFRVLRFCGEETGQEGRAVRFEVRHGRSRSGGASVS